jgi:Ran GTPase-activating protein (RanGAP) involved in mRNA processing and transport
MTKISTLLLKKNRLFEETDEIYAANIKHEFADVLKKLENKEIEAPQKSVNFILNYSKALKVIPLNDGIFASILTN